DPFTVPSFAPSSHPADAARMTAVLKALARCGFAGDVARIEERWNAFVAMLGSEAEPEYRRCFPNQLLEEVCRAAHDGVAGIGCRIASPSCRDAVYTALNDAWA